MHFVGGSTRFTKLYILTSSRFVKNCRNKSIVSTTINIVVRRDIVTVGQSASTNTRSVHINDEAIGMMKLHS
jgi:hypothetical protein